MGHTHGPRLVLDITTTSLVSLMNRSFHLALLEDYVEVSTNGWSTYQETVYLRPLADS